MVKSQKEAVRLQVNGSWREIWVEPRRTLLDALRWDLGLTGSKKGCDRGQCGACTVIVEGQAVYSCLLLAIQCDGKKVETVEGLGRHGEPHPLQAAFLRHDAYQCGYCTPGQLMSAKALLDQNPHPSDEEIQEALAGNLCRCGAYAHIMEAVKEVAQGATDRAHSV